MHAVVAHHRWTRWIAALAILWASLAPAMGQALASTTGKHWVEICTTQGSKWIEAGLHGSEQAPISAHVPDHCPVCSLHSPVLGLPPAVPVAPLPLGLSDELPVAFLSAPRTPHAWVSAQPRGPPHFS